MSQQQEPSNPSSPKANEQHVTPEKLSRIFESALDIVSADREAKRQAMATTAVFVSLSDQKMAFLIELADRRVAIAVPAIRRQTANALQYAINRLGRENVAVIMDCDENVFRLGYGDIESLKILRTAGCVVRQSSGLRVGALICDDQAWVFAPTALYVQAESQSDETPNAVSLRASDVEQIVSRMVPGELPSDEGELFPDEERPEIVYPGVEIGHKEIPNQVFEQTLTALEQAPPVAFDVARQVRVFEPYIQYVEISLHGCAIQSASAAVLGRLRRRRPAALPGVRAGRERWRRRRRWVGVQF
jgi:hypothetical protein